MNISQVIPVTKQALVIKHYQQMNLKKKTKRNLRNQRRIKKRKRKSFIPILTIIQLMRS